MMMETTPRFLQGVYQFHGNGLGAPAPLAQSLAYTVPADKRAQMIYFRAGNSADALVVVSFLVDGKLFRLFPLGAKAGIHVPLAVVEDLQPGSVLALTIAAPAGVSGEVAIDVGLIEI